MTAGRSAECGFTLIELMVALLIFGMISAAGIALLRSSIDAEAASRTRLDAAAAAARANGLITGDLAQALSRLSRNERGDPVPAFEGLSANAAVMMRFIRGGWSNLDNAPRASLQKVEYRFAEGRLERRTYGALDGAEPGPWAVLAGRIGRVEVRYRGYDGGWADHWQPLDPKLLPSAVELVLTPQRGPPLRELFLVGPGSS